MEENRTSKPKTNRRSVIAIAITSIVGWCLAYLSFNGFRTYSTGLFIWLPFVMGAISTLIYSYKNTNTRKKAFVVSLNTLAVFCIGLLFLALEGIICMIMALPIGLFFTWIGHLIAFELVKNKTGNITLPVIILVLSVPAVMAFEKRNGSKEKIRSVTTSIEINASPEKIWKYLVAFPELDKPTELIFKMGIAYPTNATIRGKGVGAIRHCDFSTGSFVESITIWDEPRLLKFDVVSQPETMKELSFYDIHPHHLHGYWVSKQGQFRLIPLANGNIKLEGTTWYTNKIKPGFYWNIWSDHIVHKIHRRVLQHIRKLAEE